MAKPQYNHNLLNIRARQGLDARYTHVELLQLDVNEANYRPHHRRRQNHPLIYYHRHQHSVAYQQLDQ